jgi:release factor glutamine methyltransferase
MNIREWITLAESRLESAGVIAARLEAQVLASHVLGVERSWLFAHPEKDIDESLGEEALRRRIAGEPLAYILGYREFFGRQFGVDPSVLIPRHETEVLVEATLSHQSTYASVLDLGTGSGVIAITLKLERPSWRLTAVDLSPEALVVASANARFHRAEVRILLSDGFEALLGESFDMIVSNPPYVWKDEPLPLEVAGFEPACALFAEDSGLAFFTRLAAEAADYLSDGGALLVEVGHTQSAAVLELFQSSGWRSTEIRRDFAGVERVLKFEPVIL